jgi:hypothetical protein
LVALPTLAFGTYTNVSNTVIVGTEPVLQVIASAVDTSYVYTATNQTGTNTHTAQFALADMPSDFSNMDTLSVRMRYLKASAGANMAWTLRAQVFKSDGTTPLTDAVDVAVAITTTTATNSAVINFTGVDTTASKADWDEAVVHVLFVLTRSAGGDTIQKRVTAAELTGTYSIFVPTGVLNQSIGAIVPVAAGTLRVQGVLSQALGAVTVVSEIAPTGSWAAETTTWDTITRAWDDTGSGAIEGTLSQSVGAVGLSTAGALSVQGALTQSVGNVTVVSTGTVSVQGTLSQSMGVVGLTSTGELLVQGTLSAGVGAISLASTSALLLQGVVSQSVGPVALSAQGALTIEGELGVTLSPVEVSATSVLSVQGELSQSVGLVTLEAAGELVLESGTGVLSQSVGLVELSAEGALGRVGEVDSLVGSVALSAAGALALTGEAAVALGPVGLSSAGTLRITGTLTQTTGLVALSAEGTVGIQTSGVLTQTLAPVGLSSSGVLRVQGQVASTLPAVALSAQSTLTIEALLARTLDAITLEAAGRELSDILGVLNTSVGSITLLGRGKLDVFVPTVPPNTPLSERIPIDQRRRPYGSLFIRAWRTGW